MIKRKSVFADPINGGPGNDNYLVTDSAQIIHEALGGGYDTVYTTVSYALTAGSEIEVLTVYDRDTVNAVNLTGNAFANTIYGNNGSNTLLGEGGADSFYGLGGDDRYLVDSLSDQVFESAGGGYDTVYAFGDFALNNASFVDALSVYDRDTTNALTLFGNELANIIYGNNGSNALLGGGGTDTLYGLGGDDRFVIDSADDQVIEFAGGGNDTVYAVNSYALAGDAHVETLAVYDRDTVNAVNLTGNAFANTIYGNNGSNTLLGEGGADIFYGLGGDDRYLVDSLSDQVFESAGGGYDTVYTFGDFALNNASFVDALSVYDRDTTNALTLFGNELANIIYGNNGSNTLLGGGGTDTLYGLGGDDRFVIDSADDVIFEFAGGGNDTVYAVNSYTLASDAEVETLTVYDRDTTNAVNLNGNGIANLIYGNNGANTIDGKGGADTLYGMGGADMFAFTGALGAGNVDGIGDFNVADDTIRLGGGGGEPFAALASGALSAASFVIGGGALDANDYLIYNSGTGALLYDADGSGAGAAVQFATLATGLALTGADFFVSGPANAPPAITSASTASVTENSPASTIVYQTAASDADGDRITYALTGADASLLSIDANGAVRLNAVPDFELKTTYNFNVAVSDSGTSATRNVVLSIIDQQDSGTPIINETTSPNDAFASAQVVNRGTLAIAANPNLPDDDLPSATISGSIASNGDEDFFSITLAAGEKLILDVDGPTPGGLDSHIFVYGPNMVEIGNNDDRGLFDPGSTGIATSHNTDSFFQFRAPADGTYYFSIKAFQGLSAGSYQLHVSIAPPASADEIRAEALDADAEALISGAQWNRSNLTYGFPQDASQYPTQFDELSTNGNNEFQPFSSVQQAATRQLVQLVANVSGLTLTELVANPGQADLRYAMSTDDDVEAAHAFYPTNGGPTSAGGTSWYNTTSFNNPLKGNYAWMGILHETGHALGLEHGHEDPPVVSAPHDSVEYTVMTYRSYVGDPLTGGYSNEQMGYPQTLMMLDIVALQKLYGANFTFNSGASIYSWNSNTGEMSINGVGQGAPGNGSGGSSNRVFMTIWDGGGNDTYDMSNYGSGVTIDLRPGEWSTTSQSQIANLGDGNSARGNIANALQFQGDGRSLIENAIGGAGSDTLIANRAANQLTGNGGNDIFKWSSAGNAGTGTGADTILDLLRGGDRIDLSEIDAIAGGGDDAFSFIGTSAFHNVAGELRYQVEGANLRIQGDIDGNGLSDFEIVVNNNSIFAASDFVL